MTFRGPFAPGPWFSWSPPVQTLSPKRRVRIEDPYAILGVPPTASTVEIKRAYRALAKRHHPDLNPDDPDAEARFKRIAQAFEAVSDPARRRSVDRRRSTGPSGLSEDFLDDVATAIERAQTYVERMVLPHYARHLRGVGAEFAARLVADLDALADPSTLMGGDPPGWWAARRAARLTVGIAVGLDPRPSPDASYVQRLSGGGWQIVVAPWALHRAGFDGPTDIDDAILRILLARYAQILARGRILGPVPIDRGREIDDAHRRSTLGWWGGVALLATAVATLLYSGFAGW